MARTRKPVLGPRPASASSELLALGTVVPQVVAQRMQRMAMAGPKPSARDRREFNRMVVEKQVAFAESWFAMWTEALHAQQRMAWSWLGIGSPMGALDAWERVAARGIAPVRRKAVANARRLGRAG